jgi:hypothetical protein
MPGEVAHDFTAVGGVADMHGILQV